MVTLSTGMIGQIEREKTTPSVESLDAIIKELGIDPWALFIDTPPSNTELSVSYIIVSRIIPGQQHLLLKFARTIREYRYVLIILAQTVLETTQTTKTPP